MYPKWVPFTTVEVLQNLGLYLLNGLNISPRVEMKFDNVEDDPINGSEFVYGVHLVMLQGEDTKN